MKSLTHIRCDNVAGDLLLKYIYVFAIPTLQYLNVRFSIDTEIDIEIEEIRAGLRVLGCCVDMRNPLINFSNLREFHVKNIHLKTHVFSRILVSSVIEILGISYDDSLLYIDGWTELTNNLPNLQHLIIHDVDEHFLKFFYKNFLIFIPKLTNLKSLILGDPFDIQRVVEFFIQNAKVEKACGYCCHKFNKLLKRGNEFKNKFDGFQFILVGNEEYDERFGFWSCYS